MNANVSFRRYVISSHNIINARNFLIISICHRGQAVRTTLKRAS